MKKEKKVVLPDKSEGKVVSSRGIYNGKLYVRKLNGIIVEIEKSKLRYVS